MELTSEQVHWAFGAGLIAVSLVTLMRCYGLIKGRWPDFISPTALFLFGTALILDPWLHGSAAPANYAAETAQHLALGLLLVLTSALELYRVARRREYWLWRLPLALALVGAAFVFLVHAQHDSEASMLLLVTQHRFIGATLLVLALAVLIPPDARTTGAPSPAVPMLTFLLGLQLLIYTEGQSLFGVPEHQTAHHGDATARLDPATSE